IARPMPLDPPVTRTLRPAKASDGVSAMNVDSSRIAAMQIHARFAWRTFMLVLIVGAATAARAAAASVDGIPLHWTSTGTGPQTLVLVHGWTCDDSSWSGQVP